jgi:1,4-alpha-glucan branching enzyme
MNQSLLTDHDIYLFKEGNHFRLHDKLGAHLMAPAGRTAEAGVQFGVWAPNAAAVSVIGDFNQWRPYAHQLTPRGDGSGIWEGFIPKLGQGTVYKYHIISRHNNYHVAKADPLAFFCELPPNTASVVWDLSYNWQDGDWFTKQKERNSLDAPMSVYEVHVGSWRRDPSQPERLLSYRELAPMLVEHVKKLGFTHVEFMPVMEHPFYPSWGYQTLGYFAASRRYGCPQDLMFLIDHLHQNDIGVILDWVPSHFPTDEHGLIYFDGTHLYEHADTRRGFHPDWKSAIFNYGRNEVRDYLVSSAMFWLDRYHADALRVDAVASMLYLDYSRKPGEWIPNENGGRENLEAIAFLRRFNEMIYRDFPNVQTIAEESTAWPMVTRPVHTGGLGFGMKWNMGWMHDTLKYLKLDPIFRKFHHGELTFSLIYAFSENYVLPLSHDEVVHMKGSLYERMPGDHWQKLAGLRLLFGYMFTHPGKKLLFMGGEFGQHGEWAHERSLDWHQLDDPLHAGLMQWVADLNRLYRTDPALYEADFDERGFEWINSHDADNSILSYLRYSRDQGSGIRDQAPTPDPRPLPPESRRCLAIVCNFTPVPRYNYLIGVPCGGYWKEILNSDSTQYSGSGVGNMGGVQASSTPFFDRFKYSLSTTLPPLGVVVFEKPPASEAGENPANSASKPQLP